MAYIKFKNKRRPLVSEDDEELQPLDEDGSLQDMELLPAYQRHHIHRGARKLTRFIFGSLGFLSFFLLVYIAINSVQGRRVALSGWGFNTSRITADYVLPDKKTDLITPKHVCQSNFFLLIVVCSAVNNFETRQNIRETWGNTSEFNYDMFAVLHAHLQGHYLKRDSDRFRRYKDYFNDTSKDYKFQVQVVFLIGRSESERHLGNESRVHLKQEADQYDDLIQENFVDTYNNLTVKSVMMLKWVNKYCTNKMQFLLKCDDDTFVNVPNLLQYLLGGTIPIYNATIQYHDVVTYKVMSPSNRMKLLSNFLIGYMFCFVKPVANISSKWYAPIYMYPGDIYPKYLSGASYLMSSDVVGRLYDAALNTSLFHLEDVYITGICAEHINLPRHHNPLFCFNHSKNFCSFRGTITQHYVKGDAMREAYAFVMNMTNKCPPPDKYFKKNHLQKRGKNCS